VGRIRKAKSSRLSLEGAVRQIESRMRNQAG
jgi:hypothetical protein